jgi:TolA-binding protein
MKKAGITITDKIVNGIKSLLDFSEPASPFQDKLRDAGTGKPGSFHEFEEGKDPSDELEEMRDELNEAIKVIKYQRGKLNEVNVLNSKLLYVNKLFKAFNLTENQKIKVVDSLDQADNTKEARIIYNTLNETFNSVKTQLKESIKPRSFASKATGIITENKTRRAQPVDDTIARFKKLANIK